MQFYFKFALKNCSNLSNGILPVLLSYKSVLSRLTEKCAEFPELYIGWRSDDAKLNAVENQIDIGIRIGIEAEDLMIARKICDTADKIVASPAYLARYGKPKTVQMLAECFPTSSLINANTNRAWGWPVNADLHLFPKQSRLITDNPENELAAAPPVAALYLPPATCGNVGARFESV